MLENNIMNLQKIVMLGLFFTNTDINELARYSHLTARKSNKVNRCFEELEQLYNELDEDL